MHIHLKRSESLQDYLDGLNKETHDEKNSNDWGFFVDVEIDSHKERLKIREQKYKHKKNHKNQNENQNEKQNQIIKETHHHHHYYHHDAPNENQNENEEDTLISYGNVLVIAGILVYIMLF
jgi:hypothetical protein